MTHGASTQRSTTELSEHIGGSPGIRTQTAQGLSLLPLPIGIVTHMVGENKIRTCYYLGATLVSAIGLLANNWYSQWDSNPHCSELKSDDSANWSTGAYWYTGLDLNQRCHKEPDLQSGAIPTTLYLPIWYCGRDLNSQDHVPETQMYAYSITAAFSGDTCEI